MPVLDIIQTILDANLSLGVMMVVIIFLLNFIHKEREQRNNFENEAHKRAREELKDKREHMASMYKESHEHASRVYKESSNEMRSQIEELKEVVNELKTKSIELKRGK